MAKKRLFFVFLIVAAILAACGSPATPEPTAAATATHTATKTATATATATPTNTATATKTATATATASATPEPAYFGGLTDSQLKGYAADCQQCAVEVGDFFTRGVKGFHHSLSVIFTNKFIREDVLDESGKLIAQLDEVVAVTHDGNGEPKLARIVVQAVMVENPEQNLFWGNVSIFRLNAGLDEKFSTSKPIYPVEDLAALLDGRSYNLYYKFDEAGLGPELQKIETPLLASGGDGLSKMFESLGKSIDNNDPPLILIFGLGAEL